MAKTHWKELMNSPYLGVYSLKDNKNIIATIKNTKDEEIVGEGGRADRKPVVYFYEDIKPMVINATNAKVLAKLCKSNFIDDWKNVKVEIFADKVRFRGEFIEGLRVKESVSEPPIQCDACQSDITASSGMTTSQMAAYTKKRYGKKLCAKCAMQAKQEQDKPKQSEPNQSEPKQTDAKLPIAKPTEKDNGNKQSQTERRSESDGATQ